LERGVGNSQSLHFDEIAWRKGHGQFETVVSTEHRVLTLLSGKSSGTLQGFLKTLPGIGFIRQVSMDMCAPFAHAVKQVIPHAVIVADRFHVIRKLTETVDSLRKRTHGHLDERERKKFSRIHFLLGQDYRSLHRDERRLIRDYLRLNPPLKPVYWLAQEFRKILFHPWQDARQAYTTLWGWCEKSRKYMRSFVKTVEQWWDPVLNACLSSLSNARQEGINNKIKLIKRQGFGYRNRHTFRLKVLAAFNP